MFKKVSVAIILSLVLMIMSAVGVRAESWSFDKVHSSIGFSVRHMVISKTNGSFGDYSGKVVFDGKNVENGSVEITIQMNSLDTKNEKRDGHLKSPDFLDAVKFPTMIFISKKINKKSGNYYDIVGDLTLKDVTREVTLDAEFYGSLQDPMGNTKAGFSAKTTINRQDFNVSWSNAMKDGSLIVGNDVEISLDIELVKNPDEKAN